MTIHISGRGVAVSTTLRRRVETKVAKASRFLPKITEARAVLILERHRHQAEVTLQVKGTTLRAAAAAADFQSAVDMAVESLEQQVRRRKDRIRGRNPRASRRSPVARVANLSLSDAPAEPPGKGPALVVRRISAKPMSVDEAMDQMRVRRENVLVFTNARNRVVNVLHRRADGALELVEPAG